MTPNPVLEAIKKLPLGMQFQITLLWNLTVATTMQGITAMVHGNVNGTVNALDDAAENLNLLSIALDLPLKTLFEQIRIDLDIPAEDTIDG